MRRRRAEWMTRSDDEILEWLSEENAGTPKAIADALDKNNDYVGRRCRNLMRYGLLERTSHGYYRFTDIARQYLAGELDASTLKPE